MAEIHTVLGGISPDGLGFCQSHEHLMLRMGPSYRLNHDLLLDSVEKSLSEVLSYREAGGDTLIDAQPGGCGRMPAELREISEASGVNIIAVSGFHKLCYYDKGHWIHGCAPGRLEKLFAGEALEGMFLGLEGECELCRTDMRAGVLKGALEAGPLDGKYRELFGALAGAAAESGAPVMIHTDPGADVLSLAAFLMNRGVPPAKVMFCHLDRAVPELEVHKRLLDLGFFLEFDTIGRFKYHSDESETELFLYHIRSGYAGQLLFSLDTTRARLRAYTPGAVGLDYILRRFIPKLLAAGVSTSDIGRMSHNNVVKFFCG